MAPLLCPRYTVRRASVPTALISCGSVAICWLRSSLMKGSAENSVGLIMAPLRVHNRNGAITSRPFFYSFGSYTAVQEIATVTWSSALDGLLIIVAYPVNATCLFTPVKFQTEN